jgi:tryptophanyl-tRNA synthetase|tara:strand:+ start:1060 stop:1248 length:189 start_codon:yes stop_codon:yes gene_type:complete
MPNIHSKNTLKSPTQVAWEAMEAAKAKLIDDTKERLKEIREQVRRLETEECHLEDILRKQGR